jgi:DNA-binding Lrp family transcriptional regulator
MNSESLTPQKKDLLDYLSEKFTTSDAIKAGKEVGLSERSVMYTLSELNKANIIRKIKHGEYEKLQ